MVWDVALLPEIKTPCAAVRMDWQMLWHRVSLYASARSFHGTVAYRLVGCIQLVA